MDSSHLYSNIDPQQYLDIASVIIVVINAAQKVEVINKRGCAILGYSEHEILGKNWFDNFVPESCRSQVKDAFSLLISGELESVEYFENPILTRSGNGRLIAWHNTIITDDYGQIVRTLSSGEDISERKALEISLAEQKQQLENLVAARTAELEASNRELAAFGYSVSHDLRAPLRVIHGFAQILTEDYSKILDENANDLISRIQNATQQMSILIENLLELSRVTRSKIHKSLVNISELAIEVVNELKQDMANPHLKITVEKDLKAYADLDLMRVVLDNILSNACKYSSTRDQPTIDVGKLTQNGQQVFFIKDNGIGFDMQHSNKLFQAFQRLHSQEEYSGSGIGLATVARIIHRHGGNIWADSKLEQGTTFYFTIP